MSNDKLIDDLMDISAGVDNFDDDDERSEKIEEGALLIHVLTLDLEDAHTVRRSLTITNRFLWLTVALWILAFFLGVYA